MNNIVSHYFRFRHKGVRPAQAWAFACKAAEIDTIMAAAGAALDSILERSL